MDEIGEIQDNLAFNNIPHISTLTSINQPTILQTFSHQFIISLFALCSNIMDFYKQQQTITQTPTISHFHTNFICLLPSNCSF